MQTKLPQRTELDLLDDTHPLFTTVVESANTVYHQKLGFTTLHHPRWAIVLRAGEQIIGSASAIFGDELDDLAVFQFGHEKRAEMKAYLDTHNVRYPVQYAEITCFNVQDRYHDASLHRMHIRSLLVAMFRYLTAIDVRATLNIQPLTLRKVATEIGANQQTFCKASTRHIQASTEQRDRIEVGYVQRTRPHCVGVIPQAVEKHTAVHTALRSGVELGPRLRTALAIPTFYAA